MFKKFRPKSQQNIKTKESAKDQIGHKEIEKSPPLLVQPISNQDSIGSDIKSDVEGDIIRDIEPAELPVINKEESTASIGNDNIPININSSHPVNDDTMQELSEKHLPILYSIDNHDQKVEKLTCVDSIVDAANISTTSADQTNCSDDVKFISLTTKKILNPDLLDESVNTFDLPLRDLISKIPTGKPMVKQEIKQETKSNCMPINLKSEAIDVNKNLAPQLLLDSEGNVVIDDKSLVIQQTISKSLVESGITYEDDDTFVNYTKNRHMKNSRWSKFELKCFYVYLKLIGTNFTTISKLMKTKSQKQCKMKYNKECKMNPKMIDYTFNTNLKLKDDIFPLLPDSKPKISKSMKS
ncbi:MAG: Transcription factor TFIIIB component B, variant 2 [Marteilia pararefringens]